MNGAHRKESSGGAVGASFPRARGEDVATEANLIIPAGRGPEVESILKKCGTGEGNLHRPGLTGRLAVAGMYPRDDGFCRFAFVG